MSGGWERKGERGRFRGMGNLLHEAEGMIDPL